MVYCLVSSKFTRLMFTCRPWSTQGKRVEITDKNAKLSKLTQILPPLNRKNLVNVGKKKWGSISFVRIVFKSDNKKKIPTKERLQSLVLTNALYDIPIEYSTLFCFPLFINKCKLKIKTCKVFLLCAEKMCRNCKLVRVAQFVYHMCKLFAKFDLIVHKIYKNHRSRYFSTNTDRK